MQIRVTRSTAKPLSSPAGCRACTATKLGNTSPTRETPDKDVTQRTTLLVLGDGFRGANTFDDFLTTAKALKAWRYREQGQPIEFWSEIDFVEALTGANVARKRAADAPSPPHPGESVVNLD